MSAAPRIHVDLATERLWRDGVPVPVTRKVFRLLRVFVAKPGKLMTTEALLAEVWPETHVAEGSVKDCVKQLRAALDDRYSDPWFIETHRGRGYIYRGGIVLLTEGETPRGCAGYLLSGTSSRRPAKFQSEALRPNGHLRPRLAVLPFLEYPSSADGALGDAVAQALIRVLSRSHLVEMVAHLSSRSFHPLNHDIASVRTALMVDYLVTGRCSRSGEMLVLDVDFQEVGSGSLIWSERFTLSFENFLAGQSARIHEIARNIGRSILSVSVELGATQSLPSVASHALLMSAIALMFNLAESNLGRALIHLDEVAARAPRHTLPRAWRSQCHLLRLYNGWSDDPRHIRQRAADEVAAALDLNPDCAFSLATYGNLNMDVDPASAARSLETALRLNPSSSLACRLKSVMRCYEGNGPEAVALAERAQSLSPCDPRKPFFDGMSAAAYLTDGQFEKAIKLADSSLSACPRHASAYRAKIIALVRLGRMREAADEARRLLQYSPHLTVAWYLANHPAGRTAVGRGWAEALREAGIPRG